MKAGVIIGRFQAPKIHEGHAALIDRAINDCDIIIVLVGVSPDDGVTSRNPLPALVRINMVSEYLEMVSIFRSPEPQRHVYYLYDVPGNDEEWSLSVDKIVMYCLSQQGEEIESITLYGGRDSCLANYRGPMKKVEIDDTTRATATALRNDVTRDPLKTASIWRDSEAFRTGIIFAVNNMEGYVRSKINEKQSNPQNR